MLSARPQTQYEHEIVVAFTEATMEHCRSSVLYPFCCRVLDILLSLIGMFLSLPIVFAFGIAIKIETRGPVFYTQTRVGKGGKLFTIYKLRSMVNDTEEKEAQWAKKNDPRITKIGAIIRRMHIDETPQFLNVLLGHMSIVGPRPERPELTLRFQQSLPNFVHRVQVKPGITGWAQVNGGYEHTPLERLEYDLDYIQRQSLLLDLLIIIRTFTVVVTGTGAR